MKTSETNRESRDGGMNEVKFETRNVSLAESKPLFSSTQLENTLSSYPKARGRAFLDQTTVMAVKRFINKEFKPLKCQFIFLFMLSLQKKTNLKKKCVKSLNEVLLSLAFQQCFFLNLSQRSSRF